MAQTRTALGTNSAKAAGTSLSINNVTVPAGRTLVVGIAYDNTNGVPTSVKLGNKDLGERIKQQNLGTGFTVAIWTRRYLRKEKQRDIVATWSANIGARAMFASYINEAGIQDVKQSNQQDAVTAPATGTAVTTTVANTIHIAAFMSVGPNTDTVGTPGVGHTLGQTIGTAGAPPVSNVFLRETYEILTATGNCRATITGATSRDWAAAIVAFKARQTFTIKEVVQHHRNMNWEADWVRVRVADEAGDEFWIEHEFEPEDFDDWTDDEFYDQVKQACARYARRNLDDDTNVDEDSTRDTRMAGFANDTVIL